MKAQRRGRLPRRPECGVWGRLAQPRDNGVMKVEEQARSWEQEKILTLYTACSRARDDTISVIANLFFAVLFECEAI